MKNLRLKRRELDLTQYELSEITGIAQNDISRIENGRMSCTIDNLVKLAKALKVSTDYLLNHKIKK